MTLTLEKYHEQCRDYFAAPEFDPHTIEGIIENMMPAEFDAWHRTIVRKYHRELSKPVASMARGFKRSRNNPSAEDEWYTNEQKEMIHACRRIMYDGFDGCFDAIPSVLKKRLEYTAYIMAQHAASLNAALSGV